MNAKHAEVSSEDWLTLLIIRRTFAHCVLVSKMQSQPKAPPLVCSDTCARIKNLFLSLCLSLQMRRIIQSWWKRRSIHQRPPSSRWWFVNQRQRTSWCDLFQVSFTQGWKNIYFPWSWSIFPQFVMYFYVQKDKISQVQIPKLPSKHQHLPLYLITILPFFPAICVHVHAGPTHSGCDN